MTNLIAAQTDFSLSDQETDTTQRLNNVGLASAIGSINTDDDVRIN